MGKKKYKAHQKETTPKEPLISIELFINGIVDDRNAALLGGFLYQEKTSSRVRDTKQNYATRFEEFKGK